MNQKIRGSDAEDPLNGFVTLSILDSKFSTRVDRKDFRMPGSIRSLHVRLSNIGSYGTHEL